MKKTSSYIVLRFVSPSCVLIVQSLVSQELNLSSLYLSTSRCASPVCVLLIIEYLITHRKNFCVNFLFLTNDVHLDFSNYFLSLLVNFNSVSTFNNPYGFSFFYTVTKSVKFIYGVFRLNKKPHHCY